MCVPRLDRRHLRDFPNPLLFDRDPFQLITVSLDIIAPFEALAGVELEPGRAHIAFEVTDCARYRAAGVQVTVSPDEESTVITLLPYPYPYPYPKIHRDLCLLQSLMSIEKIMSPLFDEMYAETGRPSVPPERLLKSLVLMALYTVRSERQFCEQLDYNLLFRW